MIPAFPQFKKLEWEDKKEVESFTCHFPPYSDFNFISMWCWDIHEKMKLSSLNGNLVILFNDYVSHEHFLSFIGDNKILETTKELIQFSQEHYHSNFLRLIPEEILLKFKGSDFKTKEERNSFDYIYLVENMAKMKDWTQNTCGKRIRGLIKNGHNYTVKHLALDEISHDEYKEVFRKWAESKGIDDHFSLNEYKAFSRLLEIKDDNIRLVALYQDKVLVGFTTYEILANRYAISHFAKADKKHHAAIYDFLNWEEAKHLHSLGVKYFNWEQDLGIASLRYAKIKYKPAFFLRKLQVEPKIGKE